MTPGGALRAAGADPGASSGEEGAFRGPGAEGAGARRNGARLPGHGAGQRLVWRRTPGPSGAGASATCPAGRAAAEWPTGDPPAEGLARGGEMNGFSTEEDSREGPPAAPAAAPGYGQSCCLIEDGERCVRPAGNASFSKRVQKSISQKKLKLDIDKSVSPPPPLPPAPCRVSARRRPPAAVPGCGPDPGALPALGLAALYLQTGELHSGFQRPLQRRQARTGMLPKSGRLGAGGGGLPRTFPAWEDVTTV